MIDSQLRGLQRVLAREVHVSDILQHLTDLDPLPWKELVGFVPIAVGRERKLAKLNMDKKAKGTVDLLLKENNSQELAIEVKVGHEFSEDQQKRYEQSTNGRLILAGLASDGLLVEYVDRWEFLKLTDIFQAWIDSQVVEASVIASAAARTFGDWDMAIDSVFRPRGVGTPLISVNHKFLAVVIARRMAHQLASSNRWAWAGVTNGHGGLAISQAWLAIDGDPSRRVTTEIRWHEGMQGGEFRLGIDYFLPESREARAEVWEMAKAMDDAIRIDSFRGHLTQSYPHLLDLLVVNTAGRKPANEERWLPVIELGFKSDENPLGMDSNRIRNNPGFSGDGTQRFEAVSRLNYSIATADDVLELMEVGLDYMLARVISRGTNTTTTWT